MNRERIEKNTRPGPHNPGAVRKGMALLQGLATCGRCGRRLHVYYQGKNGTPGYYCGNNQVVNGRGERCLRVGGLRIDKAVAAAFLEAVTPASMEAALQAEQQWEAEYQAKLPESTKCKGIFVFADAPPEDGDFFVARLWDRHVGEWRGRRGPATIDPESPENIALAKRLAEFARAPTLPDDAVPLGPQKTDVLSLVRRVKGRKGSWWQLPQNLKLPNVHPNTDSDLHISQT